jgi:hypothetical protein
MPSNIVDVQLLAILRIPRVAIVTVLVKLETDALVTLVAVRVGLIDLCVFGEFAVGFERAGLVGRVL